MALNRGADASFMAEIAGPVWYPVTLVYLDWPGAPVRVHSSVGSISWSGETWSGVGSFGEVVVPREVSGVVPSEAGLRLYGVPDDIYDMLGDQIRNQVGAIYVGALTERSSNTMVGEPSEVFSGYMDAMRMEETVEASDGERRILRFVEITLGSGPPARTGGRIFHSAEDQDAAFAGDTAGRHVIYNEANLRNLTWPES